METGKIVGFGILAVAIVVFAVALIKLDSSSKKGYNIRCSYTSHTHVAEGYCHIKGAQE